MNIEATKGTKVIFNGRNGYETQLEHANNYLTVGEAYTVDYTIIHSYETQVILEEFPNQKFNSVHFDDDTKFKNRLFYKESTLCTYSTTNKEIHEGDILGYADNYPCVVLYNKWEARFDLVEFGYEYEGKPDYRSHEMTSLTVPWKILGNLEEDFKLLKDAPMGFDYNADLEQYYEN